MASQPHTFDTDEFAAATYPPSAARRPWLRSQIWFIALGAVGAVTVAVVCLMIVDLVRPFLPGAAAGHLRAVVAVAVLGTVNLATLRQVNAAVARLRRMLHEHEDHVGIRHAEVCGYLAGLSDAQVQMRATMGRIDSKIVTLAGAQGKAFGRIDQVAQDVAGRVADLDRRVGELGEQVPQWIDQGFCRGYARGLVHGSTGNLTGLHAVPDPDDG